MEKIQQKKGVMGNMREGSKRVSINSGPTKMARRMGTKGIGRLHVGT